MNRLAPAVVAAALFLAPILTCLSASGAAHRSIRRTAPRSIAAAKRATRIIRRCGGRRSHHYEAATDLGCSRDRTSKNLRKSATSDFGGRARNP